MKFDTYMLKTLKKKKCNSTVRFSKYIVVNFTSGSYRLKL